MVKLMAGGQDCLPLTLSKYRLFGFLISQFLVFPNGSRPQFSQLPNSYLPYENALRSVVKNTQYSLVICAYQSSTFTAPTFACFDIQSTFTTLCSTRILIYL